MERYRQEGGRGGAAQRDTSRQEVSDQRGREGWDRRRGCGEKYRETGGEWLGREGGGAWRERQEVEQGRI